MPVCILIQNKIKIIVKINRYYNNIEILGSSVKVRLGLGSWS